MTVQFITRPSYDGWGDLVVDGEDRGWSSLEDAQEAAAEADVLLDVQTEGDNVVRNPRRI
jgi:hypothetical protein